MQQETPSYVPSPEQPKRNNTPVIIGIVVAVALCCCCISISLLWQFGDQLINSFGF